MGETVVELKACPNPWCGSESIGRDNRKDGWRWRCMHCGAGPQVLASTEACAIAAWNTRAAPAVPQDVARAFEEAQTARDEAGFLGSVADCIRCLKQELDAALAAPLQDGEASGA